MGHGHLRAFFLSALAFLIVACDPGGPGLGGSFGGRPAEDGSLRVTALIGPPESVQSRILGAIANQSAAEDMPISIGTDSPAEFSITGYLTATTVGRRTQLAYVWDVFDQTNDRVHRVSGELTVERASDVPWDALDTDADNRVASAAVNGIKAWADARQPSDPSPAPRATDAQTQSSNGAVVIPQNRAEATEASKAGAAEASSPLADTETAEAPAQSQTNLFTRLVDTSQRGSAASDANTQRKSSRRGVPLVLTGVEGAPGTSAPDFVNAIVQAMGPYQISVETTPVARKAHRLKADISVSPPERGSRLAAIIWTVEDDRGTPVGTVRQVNKVPQNTGKSGWKRYANEAAERAAYGLAELMIENPI
ncbi:MAG: hypothetical protein AAGA88_13115 [Pseudomonadota bacterium]